MHIYFNTEGRISPADFRKAILVASAVGLGAAYCLSFALFGATTLPYVPFMPNPDPVHQLLYTVLPLIFSAPLFIKRQHDRNRSPMLFIIYIGMTVGLALFGSGGSTTTHPITQVELQAFVARNVVHAPVSLVGLWLLVECCFLKGIEGPNPYGADPLSHGAD